MPATINSEPSWPAVRDIAILNTKSFDLLHRNGLIELGPLDHYALKINEKKLVIPKIATSKSALSFLGFTTETIKEIWAYVQNPMSATPMVTGVPKRGAEFWNRVQTWLDDRIFDIMQTRHLTPNESSPDLLFKLGMRNDAQIQYHQHDAPPALGGSHKFCLTQVIESDVLGWANKVITRKWNMLATLEFSIFRGGDEIDAAGWAEVVKEFTRNPIASEMAYVSDPTFVLPTEILRLKGGL